MKERSGLDAVSGIPRLASADPDNNLTEEELRLRAEMVRRAREFSKDPEFAICSKIGIGACFKF